MQDRAVAQLDELNSVTDDFLDPISRYLLTLASEYETGVGIQDRSALLLATDHIGGDPIERDTRQRRRERNDRGGLRRSRGTRGRAAPATETEGVARRPDIPRLLMHAHLQTGRLLLDIDRRRRSLPRGSRSRSRVLSSR